MISVYLPNKDAPPKASMEVMSHNRIQFFSKEAFTLGCQLPDDNAQWKMMRLLFSL